MEAFTIDQFLKLENEVWSALVTGDVEADTKLLSDDFLGVYNTGFAGKAEHAAQLRNGPRVESYNLLDAQIRVLSNNIVLLSYHAKYAPCRRKMPEHVESMYVTSIWKQIDGVWQNVFSQDTPIERN